MASRAISRLLLILALIVAAHTFKPISSRSIVEQLFSATESLSFVLPDFAEVRIAQASYLATAFSDDSQRSNEGNRRQADVRTLQMVPAALVLEQEELRSRPETTRDKTSGRTLRAVARNRRIKQLIPQLPPALPLERTLAINLPLTRVDLTLMSLQRVRARYIPMRMVFKPIALKPMLPARFVSKADCDPSVIEAADSNLAQGEQPREEGPRGEGPKDDELMFVLEFWILELPIETMQTVENDPISPSPAPKNCEVALPEMVLPQQTNIPKD